MSTTTPTTPNTANPRSFAAAAKRVAADVLPVAPLPVAPVAPLPVAAPLHNDGGFSGEFDRDDIVMPRLSIVQKVGELSESFTPGTVLLNKRLDLAKPGEGLQLTVLRCRKYFMEVRPYGDEVRPRVWNTHAEVAAAGFTLENDWSTGAKATAKPVLDCVVAVHGTDALRTAPEFALVHDGTSFALAMWSIQSPSAYKESGKTLLSAKQLYLKRFVDQSWHLVVNKSKFGTNTVFVPTLVPANPNAPALAEWLDSLV